MTQITPPPNTEVQEEAIQEKVTQGEFHFIPGELEPIAPKKTLPEILKQALRPMFFGAIGIHALLLFTPLKMTQQTKPKELAEPSKIKRLTDKVADKSTPKVKVTSLPKPVLPKVAVAANNPVVIQSTTPPPTTPPTPPPTTPPTLPTESPTKSPTKSPTPPPPTPPLDSESQKFSVVIAGLRKEMSGNEAEADPIPSMLSDEQDIRLYFDGDEVRAPSSYISPSNTVESVASNLKSKFEKFTLKSPYGNGQLYEAKIGGTTRFITLISAGGGVMASLWEKSPI